jgi:hypothetical protein
MLVWNYNEVLLAIQEPGIVWEHSPDGAIWTNAG